MNAKPENLAGATGGCLCGAVRYEINEKLRGIVNCHCSKCRKFHGNFGAYTSIKYISLTLLEQRGLKWYQSITDETSNVYRGFCAECGSSLFWHPRDQERIAVAAGSLDDPIKLETIGHVWISQIGDYYKIIDDLPKYEKGWE
ncbi:MAG: GFA family protein [Candidatus Neomarinimicrobiota bacterium]